MTLEEALKRQLSGRTGTWFIEQSPAPVRPMLKEFSVSAMVRILASLAPLPIQLLGAAVLVTQHKEQQTSANQVGANLLRSSVSVGSIAKLGHAWLRSACSAAAGKHVFWMFQAPESRKPVIHDCTLSAT
jgi:hypothetical protein